MPGSSKNLPSRAAFEAGWGTLSAGAQLRAKPSAKKVNASAELEAWQPSQGAVEKPARASSVAGWPVREGLGAGQTSGCFQNAVVGSGCTDLLVKVRNGEAGAQCGAHLVRPPAPLCCRLFLHAQHLCGPTKSEDNAQFISSMTAHVYPEGPFWPGLPAHLAHPPLVPVLVRPPSSALLPGDRSCLSLRPGGLSGMLVSACWVVPVLFVCPGSAPLAGSSLSNEQAAPLFARRW